MNKSGDSHLQIGALFEKYEALLNEMESLYVHVFG